MDFTNISCYQFSKLEDLKSLRDRLTRRCAELELRGTILLSGEGINLFVAGARKNIDELVAELRSVPGLDTLAPKFSESSHQPFTRMVVRIKREIIAFGVEGIDPSTRTSPKLPAPELKQWIDEGRPFTLLDTRNDYEVKLGTFRGAVHLDIGHFKQFPEAVGRLPAEMRQQPIVMFCTGGIRCEKAGPFMERAGFENVFQLDGGILKYFEECGGAHYDGECFVFDQRVGVDPALRETDSTQCFVCQTPLDVAEQQDPRYVIGKSCPYCFRSTAEQMEESIAHRHALLARAVNPLPGSLPYENRRPVRIPAQFDGQTLDDFLRGAFSHLPRDHWNASFAEGRVVTPSDQRVDKCQPVRSGEHYEFIEPATTEPAVNGDIRILHEDEAIFVVNKPAPLPMHAGGRFSRNTLQFLLDSVYAPQHPRPVHRLDANTTGVVLFARTRHFARLLAPQFADGTVRKLYLAQVQGHPAENEFICDDPISTEPGEFGSRRVDPNAGQPALTRFRVRERFVDGTSLLEAEPVTGRTNQIRIHLWQCGTPIVGDPTYLQNRVLGLQMTSGVDEPRMRLHAHSICFLHPLTSQRCEFTAAAPWLP